MNDNPNMDDQTKHEVQKSANQWLPKEFYNLSDLEKLSLTSKLTPLLLEHRLVAYFYMTKIGVSILKNRSPETNILGEAILKLLKSKVLKTSDEAFIAIAEHDLMQMVSEAVKGNSYSLTDFEDRWTCFAPIQEVEIVKLEELLREKFWVAQEQEGFLTIRNFANRHLESFSELFGATALRFPVALQWIDFLKNVGEGHIEIVEESPTVETETSIQKTPQRKAINFQDDEIIEAIHVGLKGFFIEREADLLTLLKGGKVEGQLHFQFNQRKLVDVFDRAKYHGKLTDNKTIICKWIADNFTYQNNKTGRVTNCNTATIKDILSPNPKGRFNPSERIPIRGLPYLTPTERPRKGKE